MEEEVVEQHFQLEVEAVVMVATGVIQVVAVEDMGLVLMVGILAAEVEDIFL